MKGSRAPLRVRTDQTWASCIAQATGLAGQQSHVSVLDKVVPGYYHRRMENGDICMSTCCNNTATEHAMCERLIIDDITHWAKNYKASTPTSCLCISW